MRDYFIMGLFFLGLFRAGLFGWGYFEGGYFGRGYSGAQPQLGCPGMCRKSLFLENPHWSLLKASKVVIGLSRP